MPGINRVMDTSPSRLSIPVRSCSISDDWGGIGSGRAMAAALSAGASGVTVGTRFVAAEESPAHPEWVKSLIESKSEDTVVTEAFSYGWQNAPHRVLRSSIEAAQSFNGDVVARKKYYGTEEWYDLHKFEPDTITQNTEGTIAAMPHWAGEGVSDIHKVQPAADIVKELSGEAEMILNKKFASSLHG